jgi:hypothetical protein
MIKEITLAIALGALLGFGLTGSYLASHKGKKSSPISPPTPTLTANPADNSIVATNDQPAPTIATNQTNSTTESSASNSLTVSSPKDESIVSNSLLEIVGSASANSQIIVNTAVKHYQTTSNDKGEFKIEIDLESGLNNIQVDAFDQNDNQSSVIIQVTYSTAKI